MLLSTPEHPCTPSKPLRRRGMLAGKILLATVLPLSLTAAECDPNSQTSSTLTSCKKRFNHLGGSSLPQVEPAEAKRIVKAKTLAVFGRGYWPAMERLVEKESSWCTNAMGPMTRTKGRACTLFQALRCSKMGGKRYTVQGQAEWGTSYIKQSYGNPRNALNFHLTHDYYLAPPMPDGKKTDACTSIPGEVVKRLTPLHLGELACEADTSVNMPSLANIAELADPFTHAVRHAREQQPFGRATRLGQTVLNALE